MTRRDEPAEEQRPVAGLRSEGPSDEGSGRSSNDGASAGSTIGLVLGVPVMAYGAIGAARSTQRLELLDLVRWMVGAGVVHDLVVVPVVLVVGTALRRLVPARVWPTVRWAVVTTGVLSLLAWPFVRDYGRRPSVPSHLPRDYGAGLLAYVAAVWAVAAVLMVVAAIRKRGGAHG